MVEVNVEYNAKQQHELTLRVGDIVRDCIQKEDGWMEGELNGKRGMFPDNFGIKRKTTYGTHVYVYERVCKVIESLSISTHCMYLHIIMLVAKFPII